MSESLFLSPTELRELTGRAHRRRQIEWLRGAAWPFEIDAKGRPRVLRAALVARLGGGTDNTAPEPRLRLK
jgi:hypothetical protein